MNNYISQTKRGSCEGETHMNPYNSQTYVGGRRPLIFQ